MWTYLFSLLRVLPETASQKLDDLLEDVGNHAQSNSGPIFHVFLRRVVLVVLGQVAVGHVLQNLQHRGNAQVARLWKPHAE